MKLLFANLCLLMFLPAIIIMFRQSEYTVKFQRVEVFKFDPNYIRVIKTHNFKYNRTYTAVNITMDIKKYLGSDLQVDVQAYRFASNEYRLFPLRFRFNFCTAAERNDFGFHGFLDCGNFTGCPVSEGMYRICNWAPDGSRFPPHVPKGTYMVDLIFINQNVEFLTLQGYGDINYPLV